MRHIYFLTIYQAHVSPELLAELLMHLCYPTVSANDALIWMRWGAENQDIFLEMRSLSMPFPLYLLEGSFLPHHLVWDSVFEDLVIVGEASMLRDCINGISSCSSLPPEKIESDNFLYYMGLTSSDVFTSCLLMER